MFHLQWRNKAQYIMFTVFLACLRQSGSSCKSEQSHDICDKDNTTCVQVPYEEHPWSLKIHIQAECIPVGLDNTFILHIVGKELSCTDGHVMVGYNLDPEFTAATTRNFKLCRVAYEGTDDATFLVTCLVTCEGVLYLPKLLVVDVKGPNMELCEIST